MNPLALTEDEMPALPPTDYVVGVHGDGYSQDRLTSLDAWDDCAVLAYGQAAAAAQLEKVLRQGEPRAWVILSSGQFSFEPQDPRFWTPLYTAPAPDQAARIAELEQQVSGFPRRLAAIATDREYWRERSVELEQQVAELRNELEKVLRQGEPAGWLLRGHGGAFKFDGFNSENRDAIYALPFGRHPLYLHPAPDQAARIAELEQKLTVAEETVSRCRSVCDAQSTMWREDQEKWQGRIAELEQQVAELRKWLMEAKRLLSNDAPMCAEDAIDAFIAKAKEHP